MGVSNERPLFGRPDIEACRLVVVWGPPLGSYYTEDQKKCGLYWDHFFTETTDKTLQNPAQQRQIEMQATS